MIERTDPTGFGDTLRAGRRLKGFTQADFARAVGASQQSVSRWEGGDVPPLATLARIGNALDIPLGRLTVHQPPAPPSLADRVRELEGFARQLAADLEDMRATSPHDDRVREMQQKLALYGSYVDQVRRQVRRMGAD